MTTKWSYHSFTKTSMSFSSQKEHNFVHPSTAVCEQHRRGISQNPEHLFSFLDTQTHASVQTLQLHGVPSVSTNSWLARKGRINGRVFTSPVECDKSFHAPWRMACVCLSFFLLCGLNLCLYVAGLPEWSWAERHRTAPRFDWPHPNGLRCDDGMSNKRWIKFA